MAMPSATKPRVSSTVPYRSAAPHLDIPGLARRLREALGRPLRRRPPRDEEGCRRLARSILARLEAASGRGPAARLKALRTCGRDLADLIEALVGLSAPEDRVRPLTALAMDLANVVETPRPDPADVDRVGAKAGAILRADLGAMGPPSSPSDREAGFWK